MAARRIPGASRHADGAVTDRGYGVIAYLVMGGVVLLIIAGAVLLIRVITSSGDGETATAPSSPSVTDCSDSTWFDASIGSCVPRAVCEPGDIYVEAANTCAAVLPTVTGIAPSAGLSTGGTEVRITGTGFVQGASVLIDRIPAKDVTVVDATTITATTPGSKNLYPVDVEVANPDSDPVVLDNGFVYVPPPVKRISEINPDRGSKAGGEAVIIKGVNFVDGVVVSFFGRPATDVQVLNDGTLRVITPAGPVGPVNVNVRNPGESAYTLNKGFRYVDQPPRVVKSVRPGQGAQSGGTKVTIVGTGFAQGATVTFGKNAASKVDVVSSTRITAVTPAGPLGVVPVGVANPGLPVALLEDAYEYVTAPTIASVKPARGPIAGGTKVTISGTGFGPKAVVSVGNVVIPKVTVVDDSTIRLTMPAASKPITVDIGVTNPKEPPALAKKAFTYTAAGAGGTPTPTPTGPATQPLPRCRTFSAGTIEGDAGNDLALDAATLFPASTGVRGARLRDAGFQPNTGRVDGSILWQASPPIVFWQTPNAPGRGGTIDYFYTAASCTGQGRGTIVVTSR